MSLTSNQIESKLNTIERNVADLQNTISILKDDIASRTRLSDLQLTKSELEILIRDNANVIVDLERKLTKVILPESTQYYLEEGDVDAFKSNFSKLKAMLSRFERLYNNLVAYTAQQ